MAKTIADYKRDYAKAYKERNYNGMRAANNGANAIRRDRGEKEYSSAKGDWQRAHNSNKASGGNTSGGGSTGSYGGNSGRDTSSNTRDYGSESKAMLDKIEAINEAKKQATISGLTKARDSALAGIDERKKAVEPYYYKKKNQAAARSDVGAMNFAQYMASRGVSGNAAAMPEMYRNAGLQSQLGALDQQQAADVSAIEKDRSNIETSYQSDLESAKANVEAQKLQAYVNQMNANRTYETQQDAIRKNEFDSTIGAYSNDYMAKVDQLRSQGYSDDSYEIRALLAAHNDQLNAEKDQLARAQATQEENEPSYATALQAYNKGIRTPQVLRILGLQ